MSPIAKIAAVAAIAAPLAAGPALAQDAKISPKLAAMSAEQFQSKTLVIDDHLEAETVITTEQAYRDTRGIFKTPWNDNHLRAMVDKQTGQVRFEVRQLLKYPGTYRGYGDVNYQTATHPVSTAATKIRDNALNCALFEAGEVCFEEVTFAVDEAHLREMARRYDAATPGQWSFKFKSGEAHEYRTAIVQAEIVGLLRTVDTYKRGLTQQSAMAAQPANAG